MLLVNKDTLLFMKCPDIFSHHKKILKNSIIHLCFYVLNLSLLLKFYLSYMFFLCIESVIADSINLT